MDLDNEQWDENIPEKITKRIVWRVAQGQFDPIGLLSPYLVQLKMLMRDVCNEEGEVKATSWDAEVPPMLPKDCMR